VTDDQFSAFRSALMGELSEFRGAVMAELSKLSHKVDECRHAAERVANEQFQREHEQDRYRRRTKALEAEVERVSTLVDGPNWVRDPRDITGVHAVLDWQKKEEERRRDSGIWWKRQRWMWAIGAVIALTTASVIGCAGYVATRIEIKGGK
jgi:type II secretory pathway component PulJ